jgi:uncharacterized membrane protein YsdA (DUF1294 family)/cold shock CspA family protein
MRVKGKIASWNDEKGFGFVTPLGGGKQVFIHTKAFSNRDRRPEIGRVVIYVLSNDEQGRPCAAKATLAGDRLPEETKHKSGSAPLLGATFFLVFVGASVLASEIPALVLGIYVVASFFTFLAYARDKQAAKSGSWRTQESTLHLLSLVGGWPGAIVAQQQLRHKTKKQSFRSAFWMTVALNCGAFVWLLTPNGASTLRMLIAGAA